ncbi:hypothetical protein GCM10023088_41010 [Actinomadura verrucosospora]
MDRGTLIADRYELVERLGRGGMGEVWAGRDRDLHRDVAVKFLLDGADTPPDLLRRFEREAVAAAQPDAPWSRSGRSTSRRRSARPWSRRMARRSSTTTSNRRT